MSDTVGGSGVAIKERYGLYYPYIHIRDVNWLKASLLWFGQVRRIVPEQFTLKDSNKVKEFTQTAGPAGLLLVEARLNDDPVQDAKINLQKRIEDNLDAIIKRYARNKTPERLANVFQIHRHKLLENFREGKQLPDLLLENNLAWHSRTSADADLWVAMHPKLGAAIMSVLALAIARNEGLDVVTPDDRVHETLLAEREEDVFNALLEIPRTLPTAPDGDLAAELAQIVLTTYFDYTMMNANDIKVLIEEKKDLRHFRHRVAAIVSDVPEGIGPEERKRRLELKQKDILSEWEEHRRILPKFAQKALETGAEEALKRAVEHLPDIVGTAAAGALTAHVLGGAPGFALTIVAGAGLKMWRRRNSPYRFLNRVDSAVAKSWKTRAASLYLPQWSKLAAESKEEI